jgi:hypothetical protein
MTEHLPEAVANDQHSQLRAQPEHEKPVLLVRMFVVIKLHGALIEENRAGFLERDPVLALVLASLLFVPLEAKFSHNYTIIIFGVFAGASAKSESLFKNVCPSKCP